MGAFAETVIVDYHLSFADQGKKRPFDVLFAANKQKFVVSVVRFQKRNGWSENKWKCRKQMKVSSFFRLRISRNVETW
jgi:hypothetical protein